jgi:hypothetical protein
VNLKVKILKNTKFPYMLEAVGELVLEDEWLRIIEWCTENFGSKYDDNSKWMDGFFNIRFRSQQDLNWTVLKWMD